MLIYTYDTFIDGHKEMIAPAHQHNTFWKR